MWFAVIVDVACPPLSGVLYALIRYRYGGDFWGRTCAMWVFAGAWDVGVDLLTASWLPLAIAAANVVLGAWLYWLHRRRKNRGRRSYGYKARARIAALVAKAREVAQRRPVLSPVPGGAR